MCFALFKYLMISDICQDFKVRWECHQSNISIMQDKIHTVTLLLSLHCHFRFSNVFKDLQAFSHFSLQVHFFSPPHFLNVVGKFQSLGGTFTEQGLNVSQEKEKGNGLFELNSFLRHFPLNQRGQTPSGPEPLVDTFTNLSDDGHRHNGDLLRCSCRYKRFNHFSNRLYHRLERKLSQLTSLLHNIFIMALAKAV